MKVGFSSSFFQKHETEIQACFEELGGRDMLSKTSPKDSLRRLEEPQHNTDAQSLTIFH